VGQRIEVQLRTWEMDRVSEEGIAAHWRYKEGSVASETDEKQFAWLRQLLEWQKNLKDPVEFLETVRMDLFPDEVYVFTPKGEVKKFPKGATPVDFAYSIHSEVGGKCSGARINGKMVPLRYQLRNGNIVEIITSSRQHPRKDWLEFVKTPRAKTRIRSWIKNQGREESRNLGKDILEKALEQNHLTLSNVMKNEQISAVAKELSYPSGEDLIANIGYGKVSPQRVIGLLKPKLGIKVEKAPGLVGKMVDRIKRRKVGHGIKVEGISDMLIRFANCCHPLPGERVIGFMTRGRGITIHHKSCRLIHNADRERLVDVYWEPSNEDIYLAKLRVTSEERKGILADISAIITQKDANIIQADVNTTLDNKGVSYFTLELENYRQLQDIMGAIKKIRNVLIVERL